MTTVPPIEKVDKQQPPPADPSVDQEIFYLAATIWAEARGEGSDGMRRVAHVIKNRVDNPSRFPNTYMGVVTQKWQFSCWNANDPNRSKLTRAYLDDLHPRSANYKRWAEAQAIAARMVAGRLPDITGGADHYHTTKVTPSWTKTLDKKGKPVLQRLGQIGNHIFYR